MTRWLWRAEAATVLGGALAAESGLAWALLGGRPPGWVIAGHLGVVALLLLWRHSYRRRHHPLRIGELYILATAALGPVGALGALWTGALHRVFGRRPGGFEAWRRSLFGEGAPGQWDTLFENIASGREKPASGAAVLSFTDLIRYGDTDEKHTLLMLIAKDFKPMFAPSLRLALRDPQLRSQAAIAVARIENDHAERANHLASVAEGHPSDYPAWLELARHLDNYAYVGLWDEERVHDLRHQALAAYRQCLALRPGDPEVSTAVGRMLCRCGQLAEAADMLRPIAYGSGDKLSSVPWYGECLYRLGRFDELHHLLRMAKYLAEFRSRVPREILHAIELWDEGRRPCVEGVAP
ncbi:MAG: hypothetical protein HZA24_12280 [Nitrospirae bacterium]|nr:hypothetical protein [Nitrospirota bacterium]